MSVAIVSLYIVDNTKNRREQMGWNATDEDAAKATSKDRQEAKASLNDLLNNGYTILHTGKFEALYGDFVNFVLYKSDASTEVEHPE